MIYPNLVLHMHSLGLSVEEVSTGRSDDLPQPCPPHALSWPLCGGGQYWEVLMINPYLVLHMRSLGLSVEEVSTGRF